MDLHQRFVQLGNQRKNLTRQLQALLPQIYKQEIYKKKGCYSIYEYAWKYAGFSKNLVDKVMSVSKHLEDKPFLQKMIEKQGIHKVALVATIATPETDKVFAKHVENLSKPALFEFAKELRHGGMFESGGQIVDGKSGNNQFNTRVSNNGEPGIGIQPCKAVPSNIKIEFDEDLQIMFLQLKKNLKKEFKRDLSHKEALKMIFERMLIIKSIPGNGKAPKKAPISQLISETSKADKQKSLENSNNKKSIDTKVVHTEAKITRYVSVTEKREMFAKATTQTPNQTATQTAQTPQGSNQIIQKCAYPGCTKPYEFIHHRERLFTNQSHESIIPLCKEHHEMAHNGLIFNETEDPQNWQLNLEPQLKLEDELYLEYRHRKFN